MLTALNLIMLENLKHIIFKNVVLIKIISAVIEIDSVLL